MDHATTSRFDTTRHAEVGPSSISIPSAVSLRMPNTVICACVRGEEVVDNKVKSHVQLHGTTSLIGCGISGAKE